MTVRHPTPSFAHLRRLTDAGGLYEHARGASPRPEHGYCVDDVARGLVVTAREPAPDAEVDGLLAHYLEFVLAAQVPDGRFHNRRGTDLHWRDEPSVDDCWGRALWGLGCVAAATATVAPDVRSRALQAFTRGAGHRSPWPRASAFAALGAAEVLRSRPDHVPAAELLADAADQLDSPVAADSHVDPAAARNGWAWPEPRLTYANAAVPEVLVAAGALLGHDDRLERGLDLLGWLLQVQTDDGHLSVVPVGGRGPGQTGPGFDQQPIEVASLADACARAHAVTGERRWARGVHMGADWFAGVNDSRTVMHDGEGGGYDGLERGGRNDNRGAESTIALITTAQHAARLRTMTVPATTRSTSTVSPGQAGRP
jgi:hypothetical protein